MVETETFCLEGIPYDTRARLFQEKMGALFSMDLAVDTVTQVPLRTNMVAYSSNRLNFAALSFSPHTTSYVRKASPPGGRLLVTLQKEGIATVWQDGRESRIEAGDFFVLDITRPFRIETGEIRTHSIYLPRDRMRDLVPHIDGLTALAIKGNEGTGVLFRAILDELFGMASQLTEDLANRLADLIPDVLAVVLNGMDCPNDAGATRLKNFHKDRIRQYIAEHLSDPELDTDMIAQAVNLSPRYIYQLFEDEPLTLMKRVWNQRLENCGKELRAPALKHRTISEIAYSWGFSDVAHFSRAFRSHFSMSPREFRKRSLAGPDA